MSRVSDNEFDPWGTSIYSKLDSTECTMLRTIGYVWALLPFIFIGFVGFLLTVACSSIIFWVVVGTLTGIIVIVKVTDRLLRRLLNFFGNLDDPDSKIGKQIVRFSKLMRSMDKE